eukprot:1171536-Alexandrium_andersonii.AAC.1
MQTRFKSSKLALRGPKNGLKCGAPNGLKSGGRDPKQLPKTYQKWLRLPRAASGATVDCTRPA